MLLGCSEKGGGDAKPSAMRDRISPKIAYSIITMTSEKYLTTGGN